MKRKKSIKIENKYKKRKSNGRKNVYRKLKLKTIAFYRKKMNLEEKEKLGKKRENDYNNQIQIPRNNSVKIYNKSA